MAVDRVTKIEYNVITIFLILVSVIILISLIAYSTNILEYRAEANVIQILSSKASSTSLTLQLENTHSSNLLITDILVDGKSCNLCAATPIINDRGQLKISCSNINHNDSTYNHAITILYGDKKKSYSTVSRGSVSGSIQSTNIAGTALTPIYEKVFETRQFDEVPSDAKTNSCPQIIVTGSRKNDNDDFDIFLYTFDEKGKNQQLKTWDLNTFDTGTSLSKNSLGQTVLFGHSYHRRQGGDLVILETNDYTPEFIERFSGSSKSEIAKGLFIDSLNNKYIITQISDVERNIQIKKQGPDKEDIWTTEISLTRSNTFLTASLYDDKIYIFTTNGATNSLLTIINLNGVKEREMSVPSLVRSIAFDKEKNTIIVGAITNKADADASIDFYSPNWEKKWGHTWGSYDDESYNDVITNEEGTIFVVGSFEISQSEHRSFLHKYNQKGELIDFYLFRAPQSLKVTQVELTNEGLYAIGQIKMDSQHDIYIAKFE